MLGEREQRGLDGRDVHGQTRVLAIHSTNLDVVGQGPTVFTVGEGGGCLDISPPLYQFSVLSHPVWEMAS